MTGEPVQSAHPPKSTYRPEIDGLRAIAVLAVVMFHAFPSILKGGFIGVDVFFVISGYLISKNITAELASNTFSLSDFYHRRVKRIFPALALVLGTSLAFGWFALLASEYKQLGSHTAAGAGFVSNLVLWRESGYFDNASETKPLLHLWSLGIEEQFYIFWPLLLLIIWKLRFNNTFFIGVFIILSFSTNIFFTQSDGVAAFYSPFTRAWQLLCGAMIAQLDLQSINRSNTSQSLERSFRSLMAALGAVLLTVGFLITNKTQPFPGWIALLPTLGTSFIILAGSKSWLSQTILKRPALVWFGLISYPLYLWHWPLLSFARIIEGETPTLNTRLVLVALAIILAWLTYRFIERPIREDRQFGWRKTFVLCGIMLAVGISGLIVFKAQGFEGRSNAMLIQHEGDIEHTAFHKHIHKNYFLCNEKKIADGSLRWEGMIQCGQSKLGSNIDIAIVGDSHAEHLFVGLADSLPEKNVAFYIRNSPPYLSNPEYASIYEHLTSDTNIKIVILTMWWIGRTTKSTEAEILAAARLLLNSGKRVFLTDDVPNFPFDPTKCKGKRWLASGDLTCAMSEAAALDQPYMKMLDNIIRIEPRIKLISTQTPFCNGKVCNMTSDGKLLYRDFNHLNVNGSRFIGTKIAKELLQ
jgi:peptidoglycan/LPS O-acetylase OafA/YrhL